jgi:hypothetical protein|uniref:Uncharacterized protein n=1 Tax=viral metagenome TaxID=1070528 RepID=A0A6C0IRW0_9ZZZZ
MSYNPKHLDKLWKLYLEPSGVKHPKGKLGKALECLYVNMGQPIHIDKIKEYVSQTETLTGTDPLQVRHLSTQNGWNVIKNGRFEHCLVNVFETHPSFIRDRRGDQVTAEIWANLKKEYDNMCVNCGSKETEPMRWDKSIVTKLQKGHMDPEKDLTEDNCIPQCSFCNQRYKDKAVFDKRGQVIRLR